MTWIDITMPLYNSIAHWPGDTPFHYSLSATIAETGSVNVGMIQTSTHTGTHADAPFHFRQDGQTIDQLPLDLFIGRALLVEALNVEAFDQAFFETLDLTSVERLLLKTKTATHLQRFPETIPSFSADGAKYLQKKGIRLIGVDVPSVDPLTSKALTGHHSLHQANIHIIENLWLDQVQAGFYELIALPLRIMNADGSPVRAVLKPLNGGSTDEKR